MPGTKLTQRRVEMLKFATGAEIVVQDEMTPGLSLRVGKKRKTWAVRTRDKAGKEHRAKLATLDTMTLADARKSARAWIETTQAIVRERREATVADLVARFVHEELDERQRLGNIRPITAREYTRQCDRYILPALGAMKVASVTRDDISATVGPLPKYMRNRVAGLLKQLFDHAELWGMKPESVRNPVYKITRAKEAKRERTLTAEEETAIGRALDSLADEHPAAVSALRFLALSGLRIGDAVKTAANTGGLRWTDYDAKTGIVRLPDAKTGPRQHRLDPVTRALLDGLPKRGIYVFTKNGAPANDKRARVVFRKAVALAGIVATPGNPLPRVHDLRRGVVSAAANQGAGVAALQGLLGHADPKVAIGYAQDSAEAVDALRASVAADKAETFGVSAVVVDHPAFRRA